MSDEKKDIEAPRAPAVHSDQLWDGPREVRNIYEKPVYIETKREYWEHLGRAGMIMPDQAESNTRDHLREIKVPEELTEAPQRKPMTQGEAHLLAAVNAVFRGRDIPITVFTCNPCFVRKRFPGFKVEMGETGVQFTCLCGTFGYKAPTGTTDLFMSKLPNLALKSEAPTIGSITLADGTCIPMPVVFLNDQEALIIQAFAKWLSDRDINFHSFHAHCFEGDPENFENSLQWKIATDEIVSICSCTQRHWRASTFRETAH